MNYFACFFLLCIGIFYDRLNSISREDFFFTKYIVIKNPSLAKILVSGLIVIKRGKVQKNKHRERISVCGIILYIISTVLALILLLCYVLKSDFIEVITPIFAVNLFINITIDNINKLPYVVKEAKYKKLVKFSYILLCAFIACFSLLILIGSLGLILK